MLSVGLLEKNPPSVRSYSCHQAIRKAGHFGKTLAVLICTLLLVAFVFAGCSARTARPDESQSLTPASGAAIGESTRTFMRTVAHDVTQEGPLAWLKFFDASPGFFMAVNGQLAFPTATAAEEGTQNFARTINRIDLTWGDDLRIDPLTTKLAVVATSWHEIQVDKAGHRIEQAGYFTGLAEYRDDGWRFRDAHWSAPISPPPAR